MVKEKTAIENDIAQKNIQFLENKNTSDMLQSMDNLQNPKNIETSTILTDNMMVNALTMMNWAGQVFQMDCLTQYANTYPKWKISGDDGRGRRELIQIAEALRREKAEEHERLLDLIGRR